MGGGRGPPPKAGGAGATCAEAMLALAASEPGAKGATPPGGPTPAVVLPAATGPSASKPPAAKPPAL
eukprot:7222286-Prymnesium_polylepis.1